MTYVVLIIGVFLALCVAQHFLSRLKSPIPGVIIPALFFVVSIFASDADSWLFTRTQVFAFAMFPCLIFVLINFFTRLGRGYLIGKQKRTQLILSILIVAVPIAGFAIVGIFQSRTVELIEVDGTNFVTMKQYERGESIGEVTIDDTESIAAVLLAIKSADKISNRADDDAPSDESYLLIEIFGKNSSWRKYYLYDELPKQKSSLLWVPYEGVYKVSEHNRDILYEMARE